MDQPAKKIFSSVMITCLLLLLITPAHPVMALGPQIGLVFGPSGVGDMSFNYMANQGLERAETDFGVVGTTYQPANDTEYAAKLQQCASDGNVICISVGWQMATATLEAAVANINVDFAIVDYSYDTYPSNLRGILFDEKQAGYLAGSLAGRMTTSNIVGAVGGMAITPVINFVEGYRNGAQCANTDTNVIITYSGDFNNPAHGAQIATKMIGHGADVIFAAAGGTGSGAILYAAQHDVWSIGVDADQYLTVFGNGTVDGSDKLLSSAMKRVDNTVYNTIQDEVYNAFTSGTITYNLDNDGVGLAPYHETDASIPQLTKDYVTSVITGIKDDTININTRCAFQIMGDTGAGGVTLSYTDGIAKSVTSAADGWYSLAVSPGWSGLVTPTKSTFTFVPANRSYSPLVDDSLGQNYKAKTSKTFRSTGTQDGYILESSEFSGMGGFINSTLATLRLGDDPVKKQYRSILSFNTGAVLPDTAVISKVTLKVRHQGIIGGGNPVSKFLGFMLDVKKGPFGTATLQTTDFQVAGNKTLGPLMTANVGGWYIFDLTSARLFINKLATLSGLTQIRLRFNLDDNNNSIAEYLSLSSGNAVLAARPQLIVEYYIP